MAEHFANHFQTTLTTPLGASSIGAPDEVGTAATTGCPDAPFRGIITRDGETPEIVLATFVDAGFSILRAVEPVAGVQVASAHAAGATFTAIVTAAGLAAMDNPYDGTTRDAPVALAPVDYMLSYRVDTIPAYTYADNEAGGATLTENSATDGALSVDGASPTVGQRIAVDFGEGPNGIYTVTEPGNGVDVPWVLTRATDTDTPAKLLRFWTAKITSGTQFANGTVSATVLYLYGVGVAASGYGSTASGVGSTASGPNSTASGVGSTASGVGSTASGINSIASGDGSTASGIGSTASGPNSTASGVGSTASGYGSTASGIGSTASGPNSTASGLNSTASGVGSIASGPNSIASGPNSIASGVGSTASGPSSTASGVGSTAYGTGQVADVANYGHQHSGVVLAENTADDTPTTLQTIGPGGNFAIVDQLGVPNWKTSAIVRGRVLARRTDVQGTDSAWEFKAVLRGEETVAAVPAQNEIQRITGGGTIEGGTWDFDLGEGPITLPWDVTASAFGTALSPNFLVTGGPLASAPFDIELIGDFAALPFDPVTVDAANLTGTDPTLTVSTDQNGRAYAPPEGNYSWVGGTDPVPAVIAQDAAAATWDVAVTILDNAIVVTATGESAKTIDWMTTLELDELGVYFND